MDDMVPHASAAFSADTPGDAAAITSITWLTTATVAAVRSASSLVTLARSASCSARPDRWRYTVTSSRRTTFSRPMSRWPALRNRPAACDLSAMIINHITKPGPSFVADHKRRAYRHVDRMEAAVARWPVPCVWLWPGTGIRRARWGDPWLPGLRRRGTVEGRGHCRVCSRTADRRPNIFTEGAANNAPARCPCCGAARGAVDGEPMRARQALEALYRQVALIRQLAEAEASSHQSDEIRLLRETIARLRGTSAVPAPATPAAGASPVADASQTVGASPDNADGPLVLPGQHQRAIGVPAAQSAGISGG